jgi:hypothetical protein
MCDFFFFNFGKFLGDLFEFKENLYYKYFLLKIIIFFRLKLKKINNF